MTSVPITHGHYTPPLWAVCCERNIIAKWKNVFGPITAKAVPEVSLKAQAYCLKDKTELSLKSFQGNCIMCVGLWSDVQKIVHCFFYEIVKDHRYPFNFTQVLGRRLFNGNNNVILARWTRCSFNNSVWLWLNEIVLSGSFKKKKKGYTLTFLCHDYALIRLCIRSRRLHRTIGVQSEFESHATEFCKSLKKSKSALTFPVGASG